VEVLERRLQPIFKFFLHFFQLITRVHILKGRMTSHPETRVDSRVGKLIYRPRYYIHRRPELTRKKPKY